MKKSKTETYLGFCVRARKIVYGIDNVEQERKGVYLLISDNALGDNSFKIMKKTQEKFSCPLLITEKGILGELLHRPAVKAVAIKDKNLAEAIVSLTKENATGEPQLKLYSGGNN